MAVTDFFFIFFFLPVRRIIIMVNSVAKKLIVSKPTVVLVISLRKTSQTKNFAPQKIRIFLLANKKIKI